MTPLHARPKAYRNLYNAKRVSNREETESDLETAYDKQTAAMVDTGWKTFWEKRGISKPPHVSARQIGIFNTL